MSKPSRSWLGVELSGGRYRLDSLLGEGAMGSVYRAWDRNLDAEVVVKIPLESMLQDPDFAPRFDREIRALVKLSHPHIVKVSDVGDYDGTPFAIMQFLRGGDMDNRRPRKPDGTPEPMPPDTLASWLPDIANALDFMHAKGYIHRDIKPTNILFDENGEVFLADFGVVGAMANTPAASTRAMTAAGLVVGTPEYMAPELIMGEPFDGRADQYSLAIMVYELLAGRRPFEGANATALIVQQSTQPPPPIRTLSPRVSEPLAKVIHKALEKQPALRFESCAAFAREVVASASKVAAAESRQVPCPGCAAVLRVSEKYAGKRLRCSTCKTPLEVLSNLNLRMVQDSGSNAALKINLDDRVPTPLTTPRPTTSPRTPTQKIDRNELGIEPAKRPDSQPAGKAQPAVSDQPIRKKLAPIAGAVALVGVVVFLVWPKSEPPSRVEVAQLEKPKAPVAPAVVALNAPETSKSKPDSRADSRGLPSTNETSETHPPLPPLDDAKPKVEVEPPAETEPEPEKSMEDATPIEANKAENMGPTNVDAPLVQVNFGDESMRVGEIPQPWGGTLKIGRDEQGNRQGLGLPSRQALGDARVLFETIEGEFVCEFEFILPKPREGSLFDLYLLGKAGKEVRQMLRLEFNTAVPGQFFCHASKKRKAYYCDFRDNTPMRVRLERTKGKQLEMTLNGKPVDNFHPVLFGSIDRAVIGLQCIAFDMHPRVFAFKISK